MRKSANGAGLRVVGVVGATLLFSKEVGQYVEKWISDNAEKVEKFLDIFENKIAERGGVDVVCEGKPRPSASTKAIEATPVKDPKAKDLGIKS